MLIETVSKSNVVSSMSNGIGLCYFDPDTETLKEFSIDETIHLNPYEHSVRRFYFVKNTDLINNVRPILANLSIVSNTSDIDVKLNIGRERITSKYDYYDTETNNTVIVLFSEFPSGMIPIDLYIKSNTNKELDTDFVFNISIE